MLDQTEVVYISETESVYKIHVTSVWPKESYSYQDDDQTKKTQIKIPLKNFVT